MLTSSNAVASRKRITILACMQRALDHIIAGKLIAKTGPSPGSFFRLYIIADMGKHMFGQ